MNSWTLKMISQIKSFPYPDKQGTPEKGRRMQRLKRCVTININKDEDNSPKNNTKYKKRMQQSSRKVVKD